MNGVIVIDKPAGLTSHDVVNRVRRILGQRSVGHLGTLDPSATGVLPIVCGNLTRLAQFYIHSEKAYEGVIRFGFATDTYDAEGELTTPPQRVHLSIDQLREAASKFKGHIQQIPPPFSAKKIAGVPAYKLARKKKPVELKPVEVEIKEFEILELMTREGNLPEADVETKFRARVSSGTYIRSIAHDLGQKLGCGAHLATLRRTAAAEFSITEAHMLSELEAAQQQGSIASLYFHPRKLLPQLPSVAATEEAVVLIRSGRAVNLPELSKAPQVKVYYGQRELIAIVTRIAGTLFHPGIVLTTTQHFADT
jgi:tRNA pseudouridine55 synthase